MTETAAVLRAGLAAAFAAALLALAPAAASAAGVKRPVENPTLQGLRQPKLLSDYERRVLQIEYVKLVGEIREKRAEAARDPSLAELKADLERKKGGDGAARAEGAGPSDEVVAAVRALADAVERVLYSYEGIPEKIGRLQEVGQMLEWDLRLRREQRASSPQWRNAAANAGADSGPGAGTGAGEER